MSETTASKRLQISVTPDLRDALEIARTRWPEERHKSRLVERLAVEGSRHLGDLGGTRAERRARIERTIGRIATRFPDDYLATVREGWE